MHLCVMMALLFVLIWQPFKALNDGRLNGQIINEIPVLKATIYILVQATFFQILNYFV